MSLFSDASVGVRQPLGSGRQPQSLPALPPLVSQPACALRPLGAPIGSSRSLGPALNHLGKMHVAVFAGVF